MRPWSFLSLIVLVAGAGVLVFPQAGDAAGCRFSARDCAHLDAVSQTTNMLLDGIDDADADAKVAERRAARLTQEGSSVAARAAWRDAARARIAARNTLNALLVWVAEVLKREERIARGADPYGMQPYGPEASALAIEQIRALAEYLGRERTLWDREIVQALQRVRAPKPPAANAAQVNAAARAGSAASASGAAVAAALGPASHPWPPVTDDAGLRNLWSQYAQQLLAVDAGFTRLLQGVTGNLTPADRKARARAMEVMLREYRADWKAMLSRLTGAKGLTAYAGCRSKMIAHATGVRARDRLVVRLISAVRRGNAAQIRRAHTTQAAQGAKNRRLAANVRACLKAAGTPGSGATDPTTIPIRLDLSSLCPDKVVRQGVRLVLVDGPQADYRFNCHYAVPTNKALVPVTVSIIWWTPSSGHVAAVGNCAQGTDRLSGSQLREWSSGTFFLDVQAAGGFDERDAVLEKVGGDAVARKFALPCNYKG